VETCCCCKIRYILRIWTIPASTCECNVIIELQAYCPYSSASDFTCIIVRGQSFVWLLQQTCLCSRACTSESICKCWLMTCMFAVLTC